MMLYLIFSLKISSINTSGILPESEPFNGKG